MVLPPCLMAPPPTLSLSILHMYWVPPPDTPSGPPLPWPLPFPTPMENRASPPEAH